MKYSHGTYCDLFNFYTRIRWCNTYTGMVDYREFANAWQHYKVLDGKTYWMASKDATWCILGVSFHDKRSEKMDTKGIDSKIIDFRQRILDRLPDLKNTGECACPPTQKFWDYYKSHKQAFYDACLLIFRTDAGEWRMKAFDLVDRDLEKQQRLQTMKAKHTLECPDCRVSAGICESEMKDGRVMFQGYCTECKDVLTTALPHALVAWYVEGGLKIVHKSKRVEEPLCRQK